MPDPHRRPLLTVHFEADTFAELRDAMLQMLGGVDADSIAAVRLGAVTPQAQVDLMVAETVATSRGRGRPPKAKDQTPAPTEEQGQPEPEPEQAAPAATNDAGVVQTLAPADARAAGIAEMQTFFAANPSSMPAITALTEKYGVRMFSDVPDDKAHAFLADVKLLVNGSVQI